MFWILIAQHFPLAQTAKKSKAELKMHIFNMYSIQTSIQTLFKLKTQHEKELKVEFFLLLQPCVCVKLDKKAPYALVGSEMVKISLFHV